tara:strand:- start:236 stop:928 length:693 start_codon:yes stop_codon:yes gene_type:complete
MTKGQYPTIHRGLGNLTPDLWLRLMNMLSKFEQKDKDETSNGMSGKFIKPFLAKITKAKCIASNRYEYAWIEVSLQNDNTIATVTGGRTSTGSTDEWDYAAINLLEIANTATRGSVGVNLGADDFPSGYALQCLGGGNASSGSEVTPIVLPIVVMNKVGGRATQTVSRFVFANTNETDGTCGLDELLMTDGVTEPDATAGQAKLFVDSDGGDLKVVFADGQVKTIVTDEP